MRDFNSMYGVLYVMRLQSGGYLFNIVKKRRIMFTKHL